MSHFNSVPLCYFPTLTVFVDDQKDFLNSIKYKFKDSNLVCFSNQSDALNYIKGNFSKGSWYFNKIKPLEEERHNHKRIEYNLSDLFQKIYDKERFNIVTSIVVDYDMPELNGIEFAKCLKDCDIDIDVYLLTGAADEAIAVDAFNKKLIKGYIRKLKDNTTNRILESISNSALGYFNKINNTLLSLYAVDKNSILLKDEFKNFFNSFTHKHNIIEYYLNDLDLSFVLVDNKGHLNLLFVYSESHLNATYRLGAEEELPTDVLRDLKSKHKMICFSNLEERPFSFLKDYKKHLYKTTKLNIGKNLYYYKYIKKINFNKKFLSYNRFMEQKNENSITERHY